jgi:hypothetical protein
MAKRDSRKKETQNFVKILEKLFIQETIIVSGELSMVLNLVFMGVHPWKGRIGKQ